MRTSRSRRIALGVLLAAVLVAAATLAGLLATHASSSSVRAKPAFAAKLSSEDLAGYRGEPGIAGKTGDGPDAAAEEAFQERAYPATDIPVQATVNALNAWTQLRQRAAGKNKNTAGQWTLAGPSQAQLPGILTFTGADYTTSGRITGLAIAPGCTTNNCRLWVAAAGGGIWRTDNALGGNPSWTYLSGSFGTNAIGTLVYDSATTTLYAGTGEPNASGDSEAGLGIYQSTDGGNTWTHLASQVTSLATPGNGTYTGDAFAGRSISSIVVVPGTSGQTLYVSSTRGVRGVSSVTGGATSSPTPPRPPFGLFKSTDGGANFTFIWNGNATLRGVNHVELDPGYAGNSTLYAGAYQQGIWRSPDGGTTWIQIYTPVAPAENTDRAEFAVTRLGNGNTRMYVGDGSTGSPASQFFRSDDVATGSPTFTALTSSNPADSGYGSFDYCTGQCWYDNSVVTPAGEPNTVYLVGSYVYGELGGISNARGVLYSTDAGVSFTDETNDALSPPDGIHPDQHALVLVPGNSKIFFEGSDGGLMRSSGSFADIGSRCDTRGLVGDSLTRCHQLLSRAPTKLTSLNTGLSTLQFQSLSVDPTNAKHLQGGTQDNGTFETLGSAVTWPQIIYGDGGQSGFNPANPSLRFNSFFGQFHDANFQNGDPTKWVIISGPIVSSPDSSNFYVPIIADPNPANAGTIFEGSQHVWRTQDWGGNQSYLEANCPEFTTSGANPACGDFVTLGTTTLTTSALGSRSGCCVAAVERAPSDTGTLWAATNTGRVFISKNADDSTPAAVTFTRLDTLASNSPGRFVSSIYVDPTNPNHAWISYSGYNFNTPATPGHVFEVTYNPIGPTATWTALDGGTGPLGDLPVTDLVRDDNTGDLYAATDFGVAMLPHGTTTWVTAGSSLPNVEVAGLTIVPSARKLYAATHGRSAWQLMLP